MISVATINLNTSVFLSPGHIYSCAANEHFGDIEQSIRTIKERVKYGCHSMPYKNFTKLIIRSIVQDMVVEIRSFLLNGDIISHYIVAQ